MPSKTTTKTPKTVVHASIRRTTDLKMPKTKGGQTDKRYKMPQFVKSDGQRDKRTKLTSSRK